MLQTINAICEMTLPFFGGVPETAQPSGEGRTSHALTIGLVTFDVERVVSARPTRHAETGQPILDVQLVTTDGCSAHAVVRGERAVRVVNDIRRSGLLSVCDGAGLPRSDTDATDGYHW